MKVESCQEEMPEGLVLGWDVDMKKIGLEPGDCPGEVVGEIRGHRPAWLAQGAEGQGILFC